MMEIFYSLLNEKLVKGEPQWTVNKSLQGKDTFLVYNLGNGSSSNIISNNSTKQAPTKLGWLRRYHSSAESIRKYESDYGINLWVILFGCS